jgi:carboxypeptidase C (cathepsin A)
MREHLMCGWALGKVVLSYKFLFLTLKPLLKGFSQIQNGIPRQAQISFAKNVLTLYTQGFCLYSQSAVCLVTFLFGIALAQYPPRISSASNVTVIKSPINENITISFKSPPVGTCTTIFSTQKQYTGYVNIPPDDVVSAPNDYPINTFFWFIEARQIPESAPLTVFMNGGPGSSSMVALFQENGPCEVVELAKDELGTRARDWGWDRSTNILYVDQPVQVGLSYDTPTNGSLNLLDNRFSIPPISLPQTQPSYTFLNGTFSSQNPSFSANTSAIAAHATWHFLQAFLATFPRYNPGNRANSTNRNGVVGVNLFTESYGGKYGPAMAKVFEEQNSLRFTSPATNNTVLEIQLVSVGIINGLVDVLVQGPYWARFAYNNTYGIDIFSLLEQQNAASAFLASTGCKQMTSSCRDRAAVLDPENFGNNPAVNDICSKAYVSCQQVFMAYSSKGKSGYDISQSSLDPFPSSHYLEYLNMPSVQAAIGAQVNYTQSSELVFSSFANTGDYVRGGQIEELAALLAAGIRVALIYGDRDFICNWLGGEAISFAVAAAAAQSQPSYTAWYGAGYAPVVANSSYIGGVVRQYGNLSFSRVYDAGHLVPAYQPETAFTIFTRIIQGGDISTGEPVDLASFGTSGDTNATYTNSAPAMASPTCFIRAVKTTCDRDQQNMLANGAGVLINGVLYNAESDWEEPVGSDVSMAGQPGTAPTGMASLADTSGMVSTQGIGGQVVTELTTTTGLATGVYTATGIPTTSTTKTASASKYGFSGVHIWLVGLAILLAQLGSWEW